jgi:hypothetical protein
MTKETREENSSVPPSPYSLKVHVLQPKILAVAGPPFEELWHSLGQTVLPVIVQIRVQHPPPLAKKIMKRNNSPSNHLKEKHSG